MPIGFLAAVPWRLAVPAALALALLATCARLEAVSADLAAARAECSASIARATEAERARHIDAQDALRRDLAARLAKADAAAAAHRETADALRATPRRCPVDPADAERLRSIQP